MPRERLEQRLVPTPSTRILELGLKPGFELLQSPVSVRDLVLFHLAHLSVRLPLVLEDRVPT